MRAVVEDLDNRTGGRVDGQDDAHLAAAARGRCVQPSFFRDVLQILGIELALDGDNLWYYASRPVRPSLLAEMRKRRLELVADQLSRAKQAGTSTPSGEPPFCCPNCDGLHFVRRKGAQGPWSCARCHAHDLPIGEVEWRVSRGNGGDRV